MPGVPISQRLPRPLLGNRLLRACLLVSILSAVFLAGCCFFLHLYSCSVRDPVPIARMPPVPPTSAPSNSLTASSAHLPCLRPLFPSFIFALLTIKKYIKKFFYNGVLISATQQCKSAIIIHTPPAPWSLPFPQVITVPTWAPYGTQELLTGSPPYT